MTRAHCSLLRAQQAGYGRMRTWSRALLHSTTPAAPLHVTTQSPGQYTKWPQGSQHHVATLKVCRDTTLANLGRDLKSMSQHNNFLLHTARRNLKGHPCSDTKTMSRHQISPNSVATSKQCRDTSSALLCRDTKSVLRHQFLLLCSFCVATPKAMSRHPQQLPLS